MNFIFFNIVLLFAGFTAVLIFSISLMACLVPMALFAKSKSPPKVIMLLFLGIAGIYQIYFWGFWAAFCIAMTIKFIQKSEVTWNWLYWVSGFMWCTALIGWLSHKEMQSSQSLEETREIQKGTTIYSLIAIVAFLVFAFFPSLMLTPYGWALKPLGLQVSSMPSEYSADNENFKKTITLLNEARDLSNPPESKNKPPFKLSKDIENKIFYNTDEGIKSGRLVSDEFLDYVHPELRDMFRNKLLKGTEIYYDGVKTNDAGEVAEGFKKQIQGNELIIEWLNWWERNGKNIVDKVYQKTSNSH